MCYPLVDNDGDCFGAIQAINKKLNNNNNNRQNEENCFDSNDEELLNVFSKQASVILKNMLSKDENEMQVNRLRMIINYSIELNKVKDLNQFIDLTEKTLLNIFSASNVRILFNINDYLFDYTQKKFYKKKNLGIIYFVYKSKNYHCCKNIKYCPYYNVLTDIETTQNLVTYSVIDRDNDRLFMILQVSCSIILVELTKKLKDVEGMIFNTIEICLIEWLLKNR